MFISHLLSITPLPIFHVSHYHSFLNSSMGTCFSSTFTTSSCPLSSSSKFGKIIRVVHMNGSIEEYKDSVTAGEVMLKQPKHFVFAQPQILSLDSKPLDSQARLQLGNIYFLLPHSVFDYEMSPMDLVTISKRLTLAAKKSVKHSSSLSSTSKCHSLVQSKKINRYADRNVPQKNNVSSEGNKVGIIRDMNPTFNNCDYYNGKDNVIMTQKQQLVVGDRSPCSWKPILESITERSFTRRSESDLQDYH